MATSTIPVANLFYTICIRESDPLPSTQEGWITPNEQLKKLRAPIIDPLCEWLSLVLADLVRQYIGEHPILTDWHNALQKIDPSKTIPPLPENFRALVEEECPFWPNQKIRDTHFLTLVPKRNGIQDIGYW
ncbi:MAG: hypothetical protein V4487_08200 [Chlamydiota bacterium]